MADRKNNETTSWNADEVRRQQTQRKQRKKMRRPVSGPSTAPVWCWPPACWRDWVGS